ncbi:MAG TPA: lamin tail domain-containing protein, partial [Verrucomicrobiales bacterium]|nr:lamin tail domain-containing protein [Verrucomicrobiales bacterium]
MKSPHLLILTLTGCLFFSLTKGHAQVRLTELLAVNTNGLKDETGAVQPWIEIWNPSQSGPVNLTNYRLVHGAVTWIFPAVHVMADERLVVFASGLDRRESTAPLHTSFTLAAGGGSLILQNSSGTIISRFNYP